MPNHDDGGGELSHTGAYIPTTHKSALQKTAYSRSTPSKSVSVSMLLREAVEEYLKKHYDDLPPEARDDLDDDLRADGGAGGFDGGGSS